MTTTTLHLTWRRAGVLLAGLAFALVLQSGIFTTGALAGGPYQILSDAECEAIKDAYEADLADDGEVTDVDQYFLPYYYGRCGVWGEEPSSGPSSGPTSGPSSGPTNPTPAPPPSGPTSQPGGSPKDSVETSS
jgi:hypothetical protein